MGTLLLDRDPVNLDIVPTVFEAHSLNPLGGRVGKLSVEIDREGFRLINKKGRMVSNVLWIELEEFKNEVRSKGRFSFRGLIDTGAGEMQTVIRVGLANESDRERLAAIFAKLPAEVAGRKCPNCGGNIIDNICQNCGQTFTGQQRRKGLQLIVIGSVLLLAGIALTYATYNPRSGSMWIFYGLILTGGGLVIGGLVAAIFGTRV